MRGLALVHAAANAALLGIGYYWLGVGETRALTLAWSLLLALLLFTLTVWTYAAPLVYFRNEKSAAWKPAWKQTLGNLLPLLVTALAVLAIYTLLESWSAYSGKPALQLASWMTLKLRKPVKPATVLAVFQTVRWLVAWVVLPVLLMPLASAVATHGWRGFRQWGLRRPWAFRLAAPVLVLAAFWLPLRLIAWVPLSGAFWLESMSFAVRALAAYCFFVAGWLAAAFVTSGGNPRFSQDNTAVSP